MELLKFFEYPSAPLTANLDAPGSCIALSGNLYDLEAYEVFYIEEINRILGAQRDLI